jgi:2',3'-cyclic-nucleotide 2'-phosphodiesterase (5'-nucleotidase family)
MKISKLILISFIVLFAACKPVYVVQKTEQAIYSFSDSVNTKDDSAVYAFILPYKEKMEAEMKTVLAQSEYTMERGVPESRLGNFVADACMKETEKFYHPADGHSADFSFFNTGGLRRPLPKGNITRGDVFELMPFENELVILTLNGVYVKKIFNFIASKDGAPVSRVKFKLRNKEAMDIYINNQPLDTNKIYKALTSDYLANGGDSYNFLVSIPKEYLNLKVRDALIQYLTEEGKSGRIISVNTDGRITHAE